MSDNTVQPNPFEPPQTDQIASDNPALPEPLLPPEIGEPLTTYFRNVYGWMLFMAVVAGIYGASTLYQAWSYHSYGQELEASGESLLPSYSIYTRADFVIGITSFVFAVLLLRAALSVRNAAESGTFGALDDALERQQQYWIYGGLLTAAELLIYFGARLYDYLEQRSAGLI